jgi:hypothetical protein
MKRLGRKTRWLVSLAVPAAVFAVNACSDPASSPVGGTGGSPTTSTGGSTSTGTGGSTQVGTGGVSNGTTGGISNGTTGGVSTGTTGGTPTGTTGGTATGTTGGTSTGTTGGTATGTTGGTSTGTTGGTATTATGGSGGAVAKVKMCATKTTLTVPLLTNFDSYDGKVEANKWATPFNGKTGADADAPYAGLYTYDDMTGTPFLGMVGGANSSTYAASISNPMSSKWGAALGVWMACVNASSYQGVSFNVRGTIPTGKITVGLTMEQSSAPAMDDPAGGGTCTAGDMCKAPQAEVPVTADWVLTKIPWSMFAAGAGSAAAVVTANGDNVAGFTFSVGLVYMESPAGSMMYVPTPAAYDLQIDDLGFY